MREWLTVIIALLILGILLDGVRRMRAHRKEALRMSRRIPEADETGSDEALSSSEFPSGGARVAGYRDPTDVDQVNQSLRESYAASRLTRGAPNRIPEQVSLNLDEPVPMLMDSVELEQEGGSKKTQQTEPSLGDLADLDDDVQVHQDRDSADETPIGATVEVAEADSGPVEGEKETDPVQTDESAAEAQGKLPDEVLIINVMARRGETFSGPALLDAMVSQGLKFGDMDIFHRHESLDGQGSILYSVANIVVPGTFEVGAMEDFQTPGISMFLSLPCPGDSSLTAFNLMAESAQAIASQLDGELKDEHRSVMTRQTIEHARQRVVEYERKRRLNR